MGIRLGRPCDRKPALQLCLDVSDSGRARSVRLRLLAIVFAAISLNALGPSVARAGEGSPDCTEFFGSTEVSSLIGLLGRLGEVSTHPWPPYDLRHHAIAMVGGPDDAAPRCVVLWSRGAVVTTFAVREPVILQTPAYWFYNAPPDPSTIDASYRGLASLMGSLNPELKSQLEAQALERILILRVRVDPSALGIDANRLTRYFDSPTILLFLLSLHEMFHLNTQIPSWFGQAGTYQWPSWDAQPSRPDISKVCYGPAVASILNGERAALLAAYAGAPEGRALATQQFVDLRRQRYAKLSGVTVPGLANPIGCPEAESIMELEEGVGDYVAFATALDLRLVTRTQVKTYYEEPFGELFYGMGLLQLLIMRDNDPSGVAKVSGAIAASKDWRGGVFGTFAGKVTASTPASALR
jgi:hypothetical protein